MVHGGRTQAMAAGFPGCMERRRQPGGGRLPAVARSGQLPQGATFRQFGTVSLTVWVPVVP